MNLQDFSILKQVRKYAAVQCVCVISAKKDFQKLLKYCKLIFCASWYIQHCTGTVQYNTQNTNNKNTRGTRHFQTVEYDINVGSISLAESSLLRSLFQPCLIFLKKYQISFFYVPNSKISFAKGSTISGLFLPKEAKT